ncbi:MAG: nuclear transport factor 2 family protein [Anaerolineae bacterium]|nr:nuclear transport factor 2 family protein [Anaerolineae bacterium]
MSDNNISELVLRCFSAFIANDRPTMESLLHDDFTFNSPRDDHIDKATYFERCFPHSDKFRGHIIEQLFVKNNEAFVRYRAKLDDGTQFRNVEYFKIDGNKVKEIDVYFGSIVTKK